MGGIRFALAEQAREEILSAGLTLYRICSILYLRGRCLLPGAARRDRLPLRPVGHKEGPMIRLYAKDIMHPKVSLYVKDKGSDLVKKMLVNYPALPVVNDELEVVGIVSEYDILDALKEKRTIHEFSAESLMSCGHAEHGACKEPVTITSDTPIEDIVDTLHRERLSILPVVDEKKRLVGIVTRKNIIFAMAEQGFWTEAEFRKRAA